MLTWELIMEKCPTMKKIVEEKIANDINKGEKTADDIYNELDFTTATLDQVKQAKINQLNYFCNKAILEGFDYTINNISYHFSLSMEAQANFTGTDAMFKEGLLTSVKWTVVNNATGLVERVELDKATFDLVKLEAFNTINLNISKFRDTLQTQVENATTIEEVQSVVW